MTDDIDGVAATVDISTKESGEDCIDETLPAKNRKLLGRDERNRKSG